MPEWVISALISLAGLAATVAAGGIAWGTLNERVSNLKDDLEDKASIESVAHMSKSLDEIKALVSNLVDKLTKPPTRNRK